MAENVRWNHPDGSGGFTELNLPSSAEIVDYDGGSVKDALDWTIWVRLRVRRRL